MGVLDDLLVHLHDQFFEAAGAVGSFTVEHLIDDDAGGPHIALGGIGATVEDLGAHVDGAAHKRLVNCVQL